MKYIKTYENFNYDSTNEGWLWGEGNIWSKIGNKISEWVNEIGEFIWSKLDSFIMWIMEFIKDLKYVITNSKEVYKTFWTGHKSLIGGKDVPGIGKEFRNDVYEFLFNKSYEEVTWSDVNLENIKRVYHKTGESLKTLFNFADDKEKLKSKEGVEDASLKLKTWFNKVLGFGVNTAFSIALGTFISSIIFTTGLVSVVGSTLLSILVVILTFLVMMGVSFVIKKVRTKLQEEGYWFKDVRDVKGYDPNKDNPVSISKISGFSDYKKRQEAGVLKSKHLAGKLDDIFAKYGVREIEENGFKMAA